MTSLEETGDIAFLHLTGLSSRPMTALKQTRRSLCLWQKEKLHLALAKFCAAHEGIGLQRIFEYLTNTRFQNIKLFEYQLYSFVSTTYILKYFPISTQ